MKRVEKVVQDMQSDIKDKKVLEVACGCAEFSIAASKLASEVCCIDLEDIRLPKEMENYSNVHFLKMDATAMQLGI